jgi:hypothetical protein
VGLSGYSGGGERGVAPGADFSFASSDSKTLGAFFCNFPSLDWRRLQSRRRVGQRERRSGAGEAARRDRLSVRRAGEASEILFRFRAISMLCKAENFLPAPRVEFDNVLAAPAGAHGQPRARVPDVVASRLPSPYHFRERIQSFQAVAEPFPGDPVLPSRQEIRRAAWDRRGSKTKSQSAATADPPACDAARRDARVRRPARALLDGRTSLTTWPWGRRVGETMKNPSTGCVYQKE